MNPFALVLLINSAAAISGPADAAPASPAPASAVAAPQAEELWYRDYKKAQEVAIKEKKPIVMLFTGSDWCKYCILLEKEALSHEEFKVWAKKNVVLFLADKTMKSKRPADEITQNDGLKEKYKKYHPAGVPTVIVTDAEGNACGDTGYDKGMTPETFIADLEKLIKKGPKKSAK